MKQTFIAEQVFDGERFHQQLPISVEDGQIVALDTVKGAVETQLPGTLVPGFIDVQVNGGGGILLNTDCTVAGIEAIGQAHAQYGTTGYLPTLITDNVEVMQHAADAVAQAVAKGSAGVLGVHFEGRTYPFLKRAFTLNHTFAVFPMQNLRFLVEMISAPKW